MLLKVIEYRCFICMEEGIFSSTSVFDSGHGYAEEEYVIKKEKVCVCVCYLNKKHLKNVGPIRHCEPPHAHSPGVATGTVARRLRIDVHDDNDNA